MKYKLGAELDLSHEHNDDTTLDKYDWSICKMDSSGALNQHVYIGNRVAGDPIIRKARELIKMLNEDEEKIK